jgi:hypothetical protein
LTHLTVLSQMNLLKIQLKQETQFFRQFPFFKNLFLKETEQFYNREDMIDQSTINRSILPEGDEFGRQICRCDRATGRRS